MAGNKLNYVLAGLTLIFGASSCSDNEFKHDNGYTAPIFGNANEAIAGKLLVKFANNPEGDEDVKNILNDIKATGMRRIFPVNVKKEEQTVKSGLHLWYIINFDENSDVSYIANRFSTLSSVGKVEYSRVNKSDILPEQSTSVALSLYNNLSRAANGVTNDPLYNLQWSFNNDGTMFDTNCKAGADVNVEKAWEKCKGDPSIIVAVVDQGVMFDHPDLLANMWVNEAEEYGASSDADGNGYSGDRHGFNFVEYGGQLTYGTGHGTHIAGTISAVNGNGIGVAGIAGGSGNNDGVKIMSCQIQTATGYASLEREAEAIKYAADNGAVVLQCSWGLPAGINSDEQWVSQFPLEKEVLDYFIHNAGSPSGVIDGGIVIFAAGNESKAQVGYPARYEDYIAVTSIAPDFTPALYTNYGKEADIAAPGGDHVYLNKDDRAMILSTMPPISHSNYELYGYKQGTSMACPHVSGVVALGLSYAAKQKKHFKADEFVKMIKASTSSIESYLVGGKIVNYTDQSGNIIPMETKLDAYRNKMGALIDAAKLLDAVDNGGRAMRVPNYTIKMGTSVNDDLANYFMHGCYDNIEVKVADETVCSVVVAGSKMTISGLKEGSTTATVSASGSIQQITLIVRKESGNGSGWL